MPYEYGNIVVREKALVVLHMHQACAHDMTNDLRRIISRSIGSIVHTRLLVSVGIMWVGVLGVMGFMLMSGYEVKRKKLSSQ